MSNLDKSKHVSNVTNNIDVYKTTKCYTYNKVKTNLKNCVQNIAVSPKPVIINLVPVVFDKSIKCEDITMETKNACTTSKIAYTRKGDLSRDNSRNQTSAERIRYLYTKAQRDCDVLRIRLKALRERHKQEKEEIKKLQTHLDNHYKNVIKESQNEIATSNLKRKKLFVSLEDPEEKDEYEKLLREVRKIKQDILNPKYPVTASNKKLEQIDIFNHNKNEEVTTCCHRSIVNRTLRFYSIYEPPYLKQKLKGPPEYSTLTIQIKGYVFPILESYQSYIYKIANLLDVNVTDSFAFPHREYNIKKFKKSSEIKDCEYQLRMYERDMLVSNVSSIKCPILIRILEATLPEGVHLHVYTYNPEEEKKRYIPDMQLHTLKSQLGDLEEKKHN
ncbi:mitochondrial ribosomal protein L48 isoform X2 [Ptiloglossa arizonensis]